MSLMQAVVIDKPESYRMTAVEKPVADPGWAIVQVKASAICATDLEVIAGTIGRQYPIIPGHEWSGIVESVGSPEDNGWIGKRVVGSNDIVCLTCFECRSGMWRNCRSFREIGFKANGAYAEYLAVPVYALYELPASISFVQGALIEPLGVALGTVEKTGIHLGDTVAVLGAGSIGLNLLAVAKASGARRVAVAALTDRRLEYARKFGAYAAVATKGKDIASIVMDSLGGPADVVLEATGIDECVRAAFKISRKGGSIALAGYYRDTDITVHIDDILINNLKVIGCGNNWNLIKKSIQLLEDGILSTSTLATNFVELKEYEKGLEMTKNRPDGFIKAVMLF